MIVMTTGLSGLMALMRQEERPVEARLRPEAGCTLSLRSTDAKTRRNAR